MNVINKLTLRHLLLNKKRTIVTIIGVILSVAMVTGVTTFASSAQDLLRRDAIRTKGSWHTTFFGVDVGNAGLILDSDLVRQGMLSRDLGYAELSESMNPNKPYLFIKEYDEASLAHFPVHLLEGRMPERLGEIVVSEHVYSNGGVWIKVGDVLELNVGQRYIDGDDQRRLSQGDSYRHEENYPEGEVFVPQEVREFVVTGIIERPDYESFWAPGFTLITWLDRDSLAAGGSVNVSVRYQKLNADIYEHAQELAALAGVESNSIRHNNQVLALYGVTELGIIDDVFGIFYSFGAIAIVIIMIGSISLIYNAFAISISERSRHLGMLASVGATRAQKRNSIFFEGLIVGLAGIPLGLLAGTLGMGVTFAAVNPLLGAIIRSDLRFQLAISPLSIAVAVVLSVLTIFISVWIPARRAAKIAPIEAIRQTQDVKLTSRAVKTSRLTRFFLSFEAELGLKNLKRNKRRYRAITISLVVSIVLYLSISAFADYTTIGSRMMSNDLNYDVGVYLSNVEEREQQAFFERVAALKTVRCYTIVRGVSGSLQVEEGMASDYVRNSPDYQAEDGKYQFHTFLLTLDEAAFASYLKEVGIDAEAMDSELPMAVVINRFRGFDFREQAYVDARFFDASVGDVMGFRNLQFEEVSPFTEIAIAALTDVLPMGTSTDTTNLTLVVSEQTFAQLADADLAWSMLFADTADPEALEAGIREIHQANPVGRLHIDNQARAAQQNRQLRLLIMIFVTGFILLITAICIANIFNTISTSVGLRRREFAMLKSVGMTPASFNRMIRYESIFYGLKALGFGLPISVGINLLLYQLMRGTFRFAFTLPWANYLVVVAAVFAVVFATMLYSSAQIKRDNIVDSLKDENM